MTHIDTDCDIATTGALGQILAEHGCTQVVRAAMTAPYGGYGVTAGIFNLADESGTAQVGGQVRGLVRAVAAASRRWSAGAAPGSDPQAEPGPRSAGSERGHYLVFCVITRPDGNPSSRDDPYARRITTDLLEHLPGRGDSSAVRGRVRALMTLAAGGWRRRARRTRPRPG